MRNRKVILFFFFQAEDGIRDYKVTGVQTCALPISTDAYRITDIHPQAEGAVLAMARAIEDAGIERDEVDYINAHGTSTVQNDALETLAVKRVFAERAASVPLSSNKSMLGHTIGAAGAIEAGLTLEGIRQSLLLPTINYN